MSYDSKKLMVFNAVKVAGEKGIKVSEIIATTDVSKGCTHRHLSTFNASGAVERLPGGIWRATKEASAVDIVENVTEKVYSSRNKQVLGCLTTLSEEGQRCSLWDIVNLTGFDHESIKITMFCLKKKYDITIIGKGDDVWYEYHGPKCAVKQQVDKKVKNLSKFVNKAAHLLKALNKLSTDDLMFHYDLSKEDALQVIMELSNNNSETQVTITLNN